MKRLGMLGLRLVPDGIGDAVCHLRDGAGIEASINPGLGSDCRKTILVEAAVGHNILRWPGWILCQIQHWEEQQRRHKPWF